MDSPPGELTSPLARAPKSQPYRTPSARRPIYSDSSDSEVDLWDAPASEMLLGARVSGGRVPQAVSYTHLTLPTILLV